MMNMLLFSHILFGVILRHSVVVASSKALMDRRVCPFYIRAFHVGGESWLYDASRHILEWHILTFSLGSNLFLFMKQGYNVR
jgi:hypothetical protein